MSEFHIVVARVGAVTKHPNADSLSMAEVNGYPVIFRTGEYVEGDLAVYLPVDSIVPADDPRWEFLGGHRRIKAKRLRDIYSQGILTKPDPTWGEGFDAREALRIEKWDPEAARESGGPNNPRGPRGVDESAEPDPGFLRYYDLESYRKHKGVIADGEEVVVTEKLHGCNARYCFRDGRLWVASHHKFKREGFDNEWRRVANKYNFAEVLKACEGIAIYGEVYGQVQDLKYGAKPGELFFAAFDALDTGTGRYLDHDDLVALTDRIGVLRVPELYRGPWDAEKILPMRNGRSTVKGADNIREGIVIRPARERVEHMGRVVLKFVGETFLLRKGA